jgi:hypothetical protein
MIYPAKSRIAVGTEHQYREGGKSMHKKGAHSSRPHIEEATHSLMS